MKILIIEDEAPAFRRLQKILEEIQPSIQILEVIDSVEEAVSWLELNQEQSDLIFMDIQLSDGISFEIFEKVKVNKPVIFTTAFDEYMLKAFKVNSIDYLLKPVKSEELQVAFNKYQSLKSAFGATSSSLDLNRLIGQIRMDDRKFKTRFLIKQGERLIAVEASDIAYFVTRNGLVYLTTTDDKKYLVDFNLDELSQQLDPDKFYRANRQFIINFHAIKAAHKYYKSKLLVELQYKTEEPITISAEKASDFKNWLGG